MSLSFQETTEATAGRTEPATALTWKAVGIVAAVVLAVVLLDARDGVPYLHDIDDLLRAVQVRQLFAGKAWYDLVIDGIAMPGPYVTPWSRIIDGPYVAIAHLLSPFMPPADALHIAYLVWPPVMGLGFAAFSTIVMARLLPAGGKLTFVTLFTTVLLMTYAVLEFVPLRIDHHNMQLLALSASLAGIALWTPAGGVLAGFAVAVSFRIGLETLPLIAAFWAALALLFIARAPGATSVFRAYSLSVAVFSPLLTLVFAGPGVLWHVQNDVFSLPYNAAATGFGLISAAVTWTLREDSSPMFRLAGLSVPGLILLGAILYFAPGLLDGPYAVIDPLSRALWLSHETQEQSILFAVRNGDITILMTIVEQTCIALFASLYAIRMARSGKAFALVILAVGLASFLANFYALRFIRFPAATLTLFAPALIAELLAGDFAIRKRYLAIFVVCFAGSLGGFYVLAKALPFETEPNAITPAQYLIYDKCPQSDYQLFPHLPPGRYMTPSRIGLAALEQDARSMIVSNISYHRAAPGMKRMFEAFYGTDPATRKEALAPFDYIAFCDYSEEMRKGFTPPAGTLFEAMANDQPWPGLQPVAVAGATKLHVYKLDHASLR